MTSWPSSSAWLRGCAPTNRLTQAGNRCALTSHVWLPCIPNEFSHRVVSSAPRQAEKKAIEARDVLNALLQSPDSVKQLRSSGVLDDMRALVPEVGQACVFHVPGDSQLIITQPHTTRLGL